MSDESRFVRNALLVIVVALALGLGLAWLLGDPFVEWAEGLIP